MIDNIVIVIPIFQLRGARDKNFWVVLNQLARSGVQVLVVEQHQPDKKLVVRRKIEEMYNSRIKHMGVTVSDSQIHKSLLINRGVQNISKPYVWVNDADCLLDFEHVIKQLPDQFDFFQPFHMAADLTWRETRGLIETGKLKLETHMNRRVLKTYGALSFMFNRDKFIKIGMMDEHFVGWGVEDVELMHRIGECGYTPQTIHNPAFHLWHPPVKPNYKNWETVSALKIPHISSDVFNKKKIIHVTNLIDPRELSCVDQMCRVRNAIESIEHADRHNVTLLGMHAKELDSFSLWNTHVAPRVFDRTRGLLYLKDMLHLALKQARPYDYVLYTNIDCVVKHDFYRNIHTWDAPVVELHRRDVPAAATHQEIVSRGGAVEVDGIDGFLIRANILAEIVDNIPDLVIGAPYWDIVVSKLLQQYTPVKNQNSLYHVAHKPGWSFKHACEATKHNIEMSRNILSDNYFTQYDEKNDHVCNMCVMILCCAKEIEDGRLKRVLYKFFNGPCASQKTFDVFICVDQLKHHEKTLQQHVDKIQSTCNNVNRVYVHDAQIPARDNVFAYDVDVWNKQRERDPDSLRLGTTSGVNMQFFQSMKHVMSTNKRYKHVLMLETDCEPITKCWFDQIHNHCENTEYVVCGSKYRGESPEHKTRWYQDHLNGVAVYRNSRTLLRLLNRAERVIEKHVNNPDTIEKWMNFDVAMLVAATELDVADQLVDTSLIANYSDTGSTSLTIDQVLNRHDDTVILHKKTHETIG